MSPSHNSQLLTPDSQLLTRINVSIGTAAVLGLTDIAMEVAPTTAYFMLGGRCRMACAFCAQGRTSSARAINLSRVTWPEFPLDDTLQGLCQAVARGAIKRCCLQVTAGRDYYARTLAVVRAIRAVTDVPLDVAILPQSMEQVHELLEAGVEHIGFGLDAACERVFRRVKGGHWVRTLTMIEEMARRFPGRAAAHLIVGLGETEREMVERLQWLHDRGIVSGLFAFTPVRGTPMQDVPPPPLDTYRRVQAARWLITHDLARAADFTFAPDGRLLHFNVPGWRDHLADGRAFQTSGCPDCNRPFYNERPGGVMYNYPRPLTSAEVARALQDLQIVTNPGAHEEQAWSRFVRAVERADPRAGRI